jgi:hypothetical protein
VLYDAAALEVFKKVWRRLETETKKEKY